MRNTIFVALALVGATVAGAAPDGWHRARKDGADAARKSGKPVLVVTAWGPGV